MVALQDKPGVKIDEKNLSELLTQVSMIFCLRDTLIKYGISSKESMSVSFEIEGTKIPVSYELPPGSKSSVLEPALKSFKAAIIEDFFCQADNQFKLIEKLREVSGLPPAKEGDETKFKITFTGKDFDMVARGGCKLCWMAGVLLWCAS
ncbi:MAG: hypothetical protein AAGF01_20865 [Cyanobacteria bacterium P01_G01_bin.38]